MSMFDDDDRYSRIATPSEAVAEFGRNAGMDNPDRAWLLHDWDVWVANPYYVGPPVPHPESYDREEDDFIGPRQPFMPRAGGDDDIPF